MTKTALIIGSEGQDGTLLKQQLFNRGYEVYGLGRSANPDRKYLVEYLAFDLFTSDYSVLKSFIRVKQPAEVYYVAAFHHSSQGSGTMQTPDFVDRTLAVNQGGFIKLLDIIREAHPSSRVFYASSSLVFTGCGQAVQNEETKPVPRCIYSLSKAAAVIAAEYYRIEYSLFVSTGIMYNHESILRPPHFLSRRLVEQARSVLAGKPEPIVVGSLTAQTDWGYAPDYVDAMQHILGMDEPNDFIISSGKAHSVSDWLDVLFKGSGIRWQDHVREQPDLIGRKKPLLIGDNRKLVSTGWQPKVGFVEMVNRMYNNII